MLDDSPSGTAGLSNERVGQLIQELAAFRYPDEPSLECDMVMASGFTSGVAYPLAACELAKQYRFRNLGGASAGAVAASTIAAAELGRATGGFQRLATLPSETGRRLPSLFQPTRATRPIFRVFVSAVRNLHRGRRRLTVAVAGTLLRERLRAFSLGAVLTFLLLMRSISSVSLLLPIVAVAVAGGFLMAVVSLIRLARREIPATGYGLCPGSHGTASRSRRHREPPPLTDWLASKLDDLGALEPGQGPLTFGHLWGHKAVARDINLEMTTTNLTLARPVRLPFEITNHFFCEQELAPLFPRCVLDRMTATRRWASPDATWRCPDHDTPLLPLPPPPELPVIVAARLSLSFPVLLAAVPLFTLVPAPEDEHTLKPIRCLFADGGITDSFPIHFFDEPWPVRPMFGFTFANEDDSVKEPGGPSIRTMRSLSEFLSALFHNLMGPAPSRFIDSPGYKERIAKIPIQKGEGSLNLGMSPETVDRIAVRGRQAGAAMRDTFSADAPLPYVDLRMTV